MSGTHKAQARIMIKRPIEPYDPHADIVRSGWQCHTVALHGVARELAQPETRTVIVDPAAYGGDPRLAEAHVAAHISQGHYVRGRGPITTDDESDAIGMAECRLGLPIVELLGGAGGRH